MTMTKKEQAEMDRLRSDLAKAKALRWPDYRPERVDVAGEVEKMRGNYSAGAMVQAWTYNAYGTRIAFGHFTSTSHSFDDSTGKHTRSQGLGGPWFPTKRDALMALRITKTDEFAKILVDLDRQIEASE